MHSIFFSTPFPYTRIFIHFQAILFFLHSNFLTNTFQNNYGKKNQNDSGNVENKMTIPHKSQAFIFEQENGEFCQSFLTCGAKIRRRSKMSWFHIIKVKLKYNNWLREAMVVPAKWFCWQFRNICSKSIAVTKSYFS